MASGYGLSGGMPYLPHCPSSVSTDADITNLQAPPAAFPSGRKSSPAMLSTPTVKTHRARQSARPHSRTTTSAYTTRKRYLGPFPHLGDAEPDDTAKPTSKEPHSHHMNATQQKTTS
ncbi:hypothetical protein FH972_022742 [Carpinus fangiana]|uniref:Uncharacterized protein n=1 Tax=Carpinus fangiana TaxID=176857 RepID=A0A5N6KTG1_9ROSI|nr:hypothetical protein FH972_022742 [Carpinus fangiana]